MAERTDAQILQVHLEAQIARFEKSLKRAERVAQQSMGKLEKEAARSAQRMDNALSRAFQGFNGAAVSGMNSRLGVIGGGIAGIGRGAAGAAVAVGGLGLAISQMIQHGDALRQLESRLNTITGTTGKALNLVFETAQRTGVALEDTGRVFARLALAGKDVGATSEDIARVTETVQKLARVGGATNVELVAGTTQLAQALASGRLQGDELRSVLENLPLVARQIADGLGVGVGQLRVMAAQGQLTSDKVFGALLAGSRNADKLFEKLPLTIERAANRATNAWKMFIGALDEATGVSNFLARALNTVAQRAEVAAKRIAGDPAQRLKDMQDELAELLKQREELNRLQREDPEKFARAQAIRGTPMGQSPTGPGELPLDQRIAELNKDIVNLMTTLSSIEGFDNAVQATQAWNDSIQKLRVGVDGLRRQLDPTIELQEKFAAKEREVQSAVAAGVIGQAEANSLLTRYREELFKSTEAQKEANKARREAIKLDERQREASDALRAEIEMNDELIARFEEGERVLNRLRAAYEALNEAKRLDLQPGTSAFADFVADRARIQFQREELEMRERGRQITEQYATAQERYNQRLKELNELLAAGAIQRETYDRAVKEAQDQLSEADEQIQAIRGIGDELANAASGARSLTEWAEQATIAIAKMVAQGALLGKGPLGGLFNDLLGGQSGGLLGNLFSGLLRSSPSTGFLHFGGPRAGGGPVSPGSAYLVGERGRELFVPNQAGTILPNDALRAARSSPAVTINTNINAQGSTMSETRFRQILDERDRRLDAELRRSWGVRSDSYAKLRG